MPRIWFRVAVLNLVAAGILGALLRYAFVEEMKWMEFRNFLYAHTHIAMLGWVFLSLFSFLITSFLPTERWQSPFYSRLFWAMQATVVGMTISFPIQGYAGWSLVFNTANVLLTYVFIFRFWRELNQLPVAKSYSGRFVKAALLFQLFSTLSLWVIAVIITGKFKITVLYYMAVQFFLHFQFNGWFIFAVLGLFFKILEERQVQLPQPLANRFFNLLIVACFMTYALAVAWSEPLPGVFLVNSVGVLIQLAALVCFLWVMRAIHPVMKNLFPPFGKLILGTALLSFILKILMQTAVVVPYIATVAYTVRNFVIGFLHLMLLGMITTFLLGFAVYRKWVTPRSRLVRAGLVIFLISFFVSEALLFLQGIMLWAGKGFLPFYYQAIFGVSCFLPVGIAIFAVGIWKNRSVR